jgi:hypothetical protein
MWEDEGLLTIAIIHNPGTPVIAFVILPKINFSFGDIEFGLLPRLTYYGYIIT